MRKLTIILCFLGMSWVLFSCSKDSDDTIILLGKERYVVPMKEMIPDSLYTKFVTLMGGTPEGFIPPNIEGEYLISEKQFCHSNFIDLSDHQDMHLRISNQHNRVANVEFHEGETIYTDTAFIMGSGQHFTLYLTEERNMTFFADFAITRCVVITGEKTAQGIKNLHFGSVILDAENGGNPFLGNFIPGWYFIYKDKDGLSEHCQWFDEHL